MSAVILDLMPKIEAKRAVEALLKQAEEKRLRVEAERLEAQQLIQEYLNAFINDATYNVEEIDYSIDFGDKK